MRLLAGVLALVILGLAGLLGYAYFGDMKADPQETRLPVQLDLGAAPLAATTTAPVGTDTPAPAPSDSAAPAAPQAGQNDLD
ncbi:hypothetical protein GL279_10940 [Paracoccus limosus]|jgi:hypothetical protein|uniref:Uncharacterized protein n=1 Tax=Paracoccus limosus TaxID=913252 RepID=A0A844H9G5_9RHOB|nr:hypothetical protein [Paracoccus limosus]MTH35118.1 hypothetical protein [Paracoccus limosus]